MYKDELGEYVVGIANPNSMEGPSKSRLVGKEKFLLFCYDLIGLWFFYTFIKVSQWLGG